jgi:NodT family efflux transporter outer membrane factor (OMF) lipoprotein
MGQIPRVGDRIATGVPSELLRRRPDIRRAERAIAAASARIGVATSDLFPKFSLNGSFGLRSEELDPLLDMSSRQWAIGPSVRWNLFDADRIRNNIEAATQREQQALATYEQTVLVALEETENALTLLATEQARNRALSDAVTHARRAVSLADERYRSGVGDFLDVLDSQRLQYDAEDQLVASDATVTQAVIALYKALGGGWSEEPTPEAQSESGGRNGQGASE